jgi:MoaA/NifB/PqqE/SkfB family radical SAM enzyme
MRFENVMKESGSAVLDRVIQNDRLRGFALRYAENVAYKNTMEDNSGNISFPMKTREDEFLALRNLLHTINMALDKGEISKNVRRSLLKNLVGRILMRDNHERKYFEKKYGRRAPAFVLVSPTSTCNLHCTGCYANSSSAERIHIDYDLFNHIIDDKRKLWGSYFTVISGGEPLMWRSGGKTILDIFRENDDNYFLMYTNGTLVDEKMAEKMAEVGNVTPAVSLEGFEKETDERRGKGTFKKVLNAFENLRQTGVPFGISMTPTCNNAEILLSDEFMDFCFSEQGAIYGWIFHYMPIGRKFTLDLMVTPEQRVEMYKREQYLLHEKKFLLVDFWNSGPVSHGCISAGRSGGYFYIDWKGDVMPCVFFPYTTHNIEQVYKNGGNLNTALFSPFFDEIRQWQNDYGYTTPAEKTGNWIMPCPIRDHHRFAYEAIKKHNARPADIPAGEALADEDYHRGLEDYDRKVEELTKDIWEEEYLMSNKNGIEQFKKEKYE